MTAINAACALEIGHLVAGEDLRTHQYKFVKVAADGDIEVCTATTDIPIGVLQNKPNTGQACTIVVIGVCEVIAGASGIVANDTLTLKADGTVTEKGTGTVFLGRALEAFTDGALGTAYVNVVPNPVDATS